MQTTYYDTHRMIWTKRKSNIVDLSAYRRSAEEAAWEDDGFDETAAPAAETRAAMSRADRRAWALDICASLGVVAMTLSFALHVLLV